MIRQLATVAGTLTVFGMACMPSPMMTDLPPIDRRCSSYASLHGNIDWYVPILESDNHRLDRWCAVVGPPVLDSIPRARFGSLVAGEPLTVAVWNTDAGAGDLIAFLQTELGLQCARESSVRRPSATHFVLLVQEALRRSPELNAVEESWVTPPPVAEEEGATERLGVPEVASRCGLAVFYAPAARNGHETRDGSGEDKGAAIVSTLPLSDPIVLELPFESARRVALAATVHDAAGDSLRLVSVHLITTPQAWRVITTANSSRARQADAIVAALEQIEHGRAHSNGDSSIGDRTYSISTVIAGDFNTWSRSESALRRLLQHFPESPRPLMHDTRGPFPTDHVLFRRRTPTRGETDGVETGSYRRIDNRYYSDHHPIVVRFEFGDTQVSAGQDRQPSGQRGR